MKKFIFPGVVLVSLIVTSCWYNRKWEDLHPAGQSTSGTTTCDTTIAMSYSLDIQPIIQNNCMNAAGCHDGNNSPGAGANNYQTFNIVRSDANSGVMMQRLDLPPSNSLHMPQGLGYLNGCDTLKIIKWIKSGCPHN